MLLECPVCKLCSLCLSWKIIYALVLSGLQKQEVLRKCFQDKWDTAMLFKMGLPFAGMSNTISALFHFRKRTWLLIKQLHNLQGNAHSIKECQYNIRDIYFITFLSRALACSLALLKLLTQDSIQALCHFKLLTFCYRIISHTFRPRNTSFTFWAKAVTHRPLRPVFKSPLELEIYHLLFKFMSHYCSENTVR